MKKLDKFLLNIFLQKNQFKATITVAGTLVDRLQDEFERWQEQITLLEQESNEVIKKNNNFKK